MTLTPHKSKIHAPVHLAVCRVRVGHPKLDPETWVRRRQHQVFRELSLQILVRLVYKVQDKYILPKKLHRMFHEESSRTCRASGQGCSHNSKATRHFTASASSTANIKGSVRLFFLSLFLLASIGSFVVALTRRKTCHGENGIPDNIFQGFIAQGMDSAVWPSYCRAATEGVSDAVPGPRRETIPKL